MQFINQFSFTLLAGLIIILFAWLIFRQGVGQRQIISLLALIIGFLVAYGFFNPGESSSGGAQRLRDALGSGTAVLLEFQSPY